MIFLISVKKINKLFVVNKICFKNLFINREVKACRNNGRTLYAGYSQSYGGD